MSFIDYLFRTETPRNELEFFAQLQGYNLDELQLNMTKIPEPIISCISAIQNAILQRGFCFMTPNGEKLTDKEDVKRHSEIVYDIFYVQNEHKAFNDLLSSLIFDLLYDGNSFFGFSDRKIFDDLPPVMSLIKLIGCKRKLDPKMTHILHYQWDGKEIPPEDVIDFRYKMKNNPYEGCGARVCLEQAIMIYNGLFGYQASLLRARGMKSFILETVYTNKETQDAKKERVEDQIDEIKTGLKHLLTIERPGMADSQTSLIPLTGDIREMDNISWLSSTRNIMYEFFGYYDAETSNYSVAERKARFEEVGINPLIETMTDQFNMKVMNRPELNTDLRFLIPPYATTNIDYVSKAVSLGIITKNEARLSIGYEEIDDEEANKLPSLIEKEGGDNNAKNNEKGKKMEESKTETEKKEETRQNRK